MNGLKGGMNRPPKLKIVSKRFLVLFQKHSLFCVAEVNFV